MKIDKSIDAMRHLLVKYANRMDFQPKEISSEVHMSDHIEFGKLTTLIDDKATEYALLEHKSSILKGFLTQMLTPPSVAQNPPAETAEKP